MICYMRKVFLLLLLTIPLFGYCQGETDKYYIYNIVSFYGDFTNEEFKVFYDDGNEVKRLRDGNGEKVKFSTPAGALMYFFSQGWEMYLNGATTHGASSGGTGSTSTTSYWILRKPCTKEEFDKVVQNSIKK